MFTPDAAAAEKTRRIIGAMREAAREGRGAVSLDGRLIDAASLRMAEGLLRKLEQIEARADRGAGRPVRRQRPSVRMNSRAALVERADRGPHVGEARAQLRVADLDGHHRVLQLGEDQLRLGDGLRRAVEVAARAGRRRHARRLLGAARRSARAARRSPV